MKSEAHKREFKSEVKRLTFDVLVPVTLATWAKVNFDRKWFEAK